MPTRHRVRFKPPQFHPGLFLALWIIRLSTGDGQISPGLTIVRHHPQPLPGRLSQLRPLVRTAQTLGQIAELSSGSVSGGVYINFCQGIGGNREIDVLTVSMAVIDQPEQVPIGVNQRPTLRTRRDRRGELQVFAGARLTHGDQCAFGNADAVTQRIGNREHPSSGAMSRP